MATTIKDIAIESGFSPATVSLVLNNKNGRIPEKTRKLILEIAQKRNYVPNLSARSLVMRQSKILGLIVPDIGNPYFSEFAKGVEKEARKHEYSVIFCNSNDSAKNDISNFKLLASRQIDGLIIITSIHETDIGCANEFNQLAAQSNIPIIQFDRRILGGNYDLVTLDHRLGGYIATKFLIDLGYKNIGCITGPLDVLSAKERYDGYIDALTSSNITPNEKIVVSGDYSLKSGFDLTFTLIDNGCDSIFASNDMMACGAAKALKKLGKNAGDDIALVGFDNSPISEFLDVPLTTVNQPIYNMGKSTCNVLIKSISQKDSSKEKQRIKFYPNLVIRETARKKI